jgi:hypothetical protein
VSTQALPHSIWPATAQPHVPLLQAVAPDGQALQPPQWVIVPSPLDGMHEVPHVIWPFGQLVPQVVPLHSWPELHTFVQLPQWVASLPTHWLLQFRRPLLQLQAPFWQTWPLAHALPQPPQFALSVAVLAQTEPHAVCPLLHCGPPLLVGAAQPATIRRQASETLERRADRGRVFIDLPRR